MKPVWEDGFWLRVDKRAPEECWLWTGRLDKGGYGVLDVALVDGTRDRPVHAHRLMWILENETIPSKKMDVCHSCDVRSCVNPGHLWLGTRSDNMRDCAAKGRIEAHKRARLAAQAPAMARLLVRLQWSGRDGRDNDVACPVCGGWESIGDHEPDCDLVKVLKAVGVIE